MDKLPCLFPTDNIWINALLQIPSQKHNSTILCKLWSSLELFTRQGNETKQTQNMAEIKFLLKSVSPRFRNVIREHF